jgi:outer membrane murein-binding lipoprotein Lpp
MNHLSSSLAVLFVTIVAAGCNIQGTDDERSSTKQLQTLSAKVDQLSQDLRVLSAAQQTTDVAASAAQSTANTALSTAQSNSTAIEAINEKIDRLFKR